MRTYPIRLITRLARRAVSLGGLGAGLLFAGDAEPCGCFAPPIPTPGAAEFAVNQQAEQIIFEVNGSTVSAHVRIFYEGDPEEFAWLLPMPSVPELELSSSLLFGLVDDNTRPFSGSVGESLCPQQRYVCRSHPPCPVNGPVAQSAAQPGGLPQNGAAPSTPGFVSDSAGVGMPAAPPVIVLAKERIGSYDTITFAADEADLAIDWLNDNGFIVNETMSPYMQPFLDADMVFVASRLVPGADVDEIRPLKLTYEAESASIPLQLTAIAAEPHMMVTAFIYSNEEFEPLEQPLIEMPAEHIATVGRSNYPLLLARAVDDEGGMAFVKEYVGQAPVFQDPTGCCSQGNDWCGAGGDGICQCPGTDFDAEDCAAEEELVEATSTATRLASEYTTLTRLSTRVSPEEMTFNPEFVPAEEGGGTMRLSLSSTTYNLNGCEEQIVERAEYESTRELHLGCSGLYCDFGECVVTDFGPGCVCDEGFVARSFTDSDGTPSLTCVPEQGTVDFAAGGAELPDACEGQDLNDGECVDIGGFPAVACDDGRAAALGPQIADRSSLPLCAEIELESGNSGARNFTLGYPEFDVCSPPPPLCAAGGWLEEIEVSIPGADCGSGPDPSWFEVPPPPECGDDGPLETLVNAPATAVVGGSADPATAATTIPAQTPVDTSMPRPEIIEMPGAQGSKSGGCSVARSSSSGLGSAALLALVAGAFSRRRRSCR